MNERLMALWDQANIRYAIEEGCKPRENRRSIPDIFSSMVIQECVQVCIDQAPYDPHVLPY